MPLDILSSLPRLTGLDQHSSFVDTNTFTSSGKWMVVFSYPADFTPVCSTEMVSLSKLQHEFQKRNCVIIACSRDSAPSHAQWLNDIETISKTPITFSVIADENGDVCRKLRCIVPVSSEGEATNKRKKSEIITRSLYIVDPDSRIQYVQVMSPNTGRDFTEVLRVLDSLQLSSLRQVVATPADWKAGHDVVLLPHASESDIETKLANSVTKSTMFPYLRFVQLEQEKVS